jgi:hypothetical protein
MLYYDYHLLAFWWQKFLPEKNGPDRGPKVEKFPTVLKKKRDLPVNNNAHTVIFFSL